MPIFITQSDPRGRELTISFILLKLHQYNSLKSLCEVVSRLCSSERFLVSVVDIEEVVFRVFVLVVDILDLVEDVQLPFVRVEV